MEMNNRKNMLISALAVLFLGGIVFFAVGQNKGKEPDLNEGKIGVVVTIPPLAEFVKRVGGDLVTVSIMVPQGSDPHTYEPTPSQLTSVSNAKVYVAVGSGIEFETAWLEKIVSVNESLTVIDTSEGMDLMEGAEGEEGEEEEGGVHLDPHVWTSPKNAIQMVEAIIQGLSSIDEEHAPIYAQNGKQYIVELEELDKTIGDRISETGMNMFFVLHPAWGYFARDYGIMQYAIEEEGKEPGPQELGSLVAIAEENDISVLFASPEFSAKSAEVIAEEIGGVVVPIDPLAENYIENMRSVAEAITAAYGENDGE